MKRALITILCMAFVQTLIGQTHWTPVTGFQSNMVMSAVLYVNGEEQFLDYVEIGAFCGEECRAAELPIEFMGEQVYFLTIVGNANDVITFRLWDHHSNMELDYVCEQTYIFVVDDILGDYPDWYQIHFTAPVISYEIIATANPVEGGTVTGAGTYVQGTTATLTATANPGYDFVNWTENGIQISTSPSYSFAVTGNHNFVANFSLQTIVIKATVEPAEGGTASGAGVYRYGDEVTLSVEINEDWAFLDWTENGTVVTEDPTFTFIATADRSFVARLEYTEGVDEHCPSTPSTNSGTEGSGTFAVYPNPVNRGETFNLVVPEDEEIVELTVVNASGAVVRLEKGAINRHSVTGFPVTGLYMIHVVCKSGHVYQSLLIVR